MPRWRCSDALRIALSKKKSLKSSVAKNDINNNAYLSYLSKLIPEIPRISSFADSQILHLGESHCLTFTNQMVQFKGKLCTIKPSLVKGAKAFHLSEGVPTNLQKISFQKRLQQNLEDYHYIFLSFGEIDCREDEGILLYCQKSGSTVKEIACVTATRYFNWTINSLSRYKEKLVYFGTPAPFKDRSLTEKSSDLNKQRLLAITVFNTVLAKTLL